MEVILKKTKITNAILKQTLRPNTDDITRLSVIGWCIYNKEQYIIFYDTDNSLLYRLMMFDRIDINDDKTRMALCKKRYMPVYLDYTSEMYECFTNVKSEALEKGQFYV